jgi:hypothetical protein
MDGREVPETAPGQGTICLKDDDSPETESCRGMKIVTLIDTLRARYNTSENIEKNLPAIGKTIRETLETNGIKDIPTEQLSDIFESFKIDPSDPAIMKAIKVISFNKFKALTGITDSTTHQIVTLQLTELMNKVNKYRQENAITRSPPIRPSWKAGRTGKKKTIRKKSKKTMKRNNKKRGSYKKYKGGNPFTAIGVFIFGIVSFLSCTHFSEKEKQLFRHEINLLRKEITKIQRTITQQKQVNQNVEILRLQNQIKEYEESIGSAC